MHAPRRPAPGMWEGPITAPPPAPVVPVTGHDEPPVLVGGEPQVSSGGTRAPGEAPEETGTAAAPTVGAVPVGSTEPANATFPDAEAPLAEPSPAPTEPARPGGTSSPPAEH